jgi:outer membrane lipoprotein-sorting protein
MKKIILFLLLSMLFSFVGGTSVANTAGAKSQPATSNSSNNSLVTSSLPVASKTTRGADGVKSLNDVDRRLLVTIDNIYTRAANISMSVQKKLKLGLLNQERSSNGRLQISGGRLRLELEGAEKSLLVVGSKKFWAVSYPGSEFKNANIHVLTGEVSARTTNANQNLATLITRGGLSRNFTPTGVKTLDDGQIAFYLSPKASNELKRALVTVSKDGKQITSLTYWDDRDNETKFEFSAVVFSSKKLPEQVFKFDSPAGAEIMTY